jgi:DNA-binding Lrp family transcriptional regulator
MDEIDRRILMELQEDAAVPLEVLSGRAGLSPSPCWRRIQKLEAARVIRKRVALLDPEKINLGVTSLYLFEQIATPLSGRTNSVWRSTKFQRWSSFTG